MSTEEQININNQNEGLNIHLKLIDLEELQKVLQEMVSNQKNLIKGSTILDYYLTQRNFHVGILKIIFNNTDQKNLVRFSSSVLNLYIRNNWSYNNLITNEEKLVKIFFIEY